MIKLSKHLLTCDCRHCAEMFPAKRFDATWSVPRPAGAPADARPVRAGLPLGAERPALTFVLWVDAAGHLLVDWPGLPGTAGALLDVREGAAGAAVVAGTVDPVLAGFTAAVPLRRKLADRLTARCMVDFGLAPEGSADYLPCEVHGHGLPALTCRCLLDADGPRDAVLLYGVDGDYPDLLCEPCLARYAEGDLSVCVTVCSRCQQAAIHRHRLVARTVYGAASSR